ncbi:hypothetical protein [Radiobacillus sp. PE A8.2]|uniref:hypothetical protein n=1 Tax=Radiobacillus sp. PE A8.2 TaxID=3380349 RepID=UPI00388FC26D
MDENKNQNMPKFDDLDDRVIAEGSQQPAFSMKTSLDPEDPTKDNPYFDNTKQHSKEEIEKFKKFFQGR